MPAKKPPPQNEKSQKQRFIETARELGVDETGKKFEQALDRVLPAQSPKKD